MIAPLDSQLIRVLLVEDNEDDYVLTRELLAEVDSPQFELEWVTTYDAALSAIGEHNYDVCLLDYRLGNHTGLEVLREALSSGCKAPIILLTGMAPRSVDLEAMALGATDFLYKAEITPGLLERSLRYAIRHKQVEAAARQLAVEADYRQQQFHALVNSIEGIVWEIDTQTGQLCFLSARAARLLGYPTERWLSQPSFWKRRIHPDDRPQTLRFHCRLSPPEHSQELEFRMIAADGRIVWLRNILTLVVENGQRVQLRGVTVDITQQKQATTALQESEVRYRAVMEQSTDCIYLIDVSTGRILEANSAAQTLSGYTVAELLKCTLDSIVADGQTILDPQIQGILAGKHHYLGEFQHRCKDGALVDVSVNISRITYQGREVFCMIAHDITEHKRAAAAQAQVEELARLNQLKDEFLSTVSHELRTPMSNIKLATQLLEIVLKQQGVLSPVPNPVNRYFQILQDECHREITLINDLLDLARLDGSLDPLIPAPIRLQDWIPRVAEPFQERIRNQQQHLQIRIPRTLPLLTTDLSDLERILTELLQNACKYTPAGETITITAMATAEELQIRVTNSGVNVAPQECDRVFDKFYRIPNNDPWKHGGTGLGLALVKKITERLSARIWVESEPGCVTFVVSFPHLP